MALPQQIRLGDTLVHQKLLSSEQLQCCLFEQKKSGRNVAQVVIDNGYVSDEDIAVALSRQLSIPFNNLNTYYLNRSVARRLHEIHTGRLRTIVLEDRAAAMLISLADPTDIDVLDEVKRMFQRKIELARVSEPVLFQAISCIYREAEEIGNAAHEPGQDMGDTGIALPQSAAAGLENAPDVRLLHTDLEDVNQARGLDIHIEPPEDRF